MKTAFWTSFFLAIIGGINWGLVGFMGLDLVALLFGEFTMATRAVYMLVGVAAVTALAISGRHIVVLESDKAVKTRAVRVQRRAARTSRKARVAN